MVKYLAGFPVRKEQEIFTLKKKKKKKKKKTVVLPDIISWIPAS
jgi:hypothetical protein